MCFSLSVFLALFQSNDSNCDHQATLPLFGLETFLNPLKCICTRKALMTRDMRWVSPVGEEEEKKRAQAQRTFFQQLMTAVKSKVLYLRITFLLMFRFMLGGME